MNTTVVRWAVLPITTLAMFAMLAAPCAFAQGTSFTYQGQLDEAGYAADGFYDFRFEIYDASVGGSQVGATIPQNHIPVEVGLFTVELNFGAGIFTGSDRWMEIGVKTNGFGAFTILSPRTEFTSTPYAIRARSALTADGVPIGSISSTEVINESLTSSDLGPNSVGTSEVINDSLLAEDLAPNSVTASELAANSVNAAEIAANAVGVSEIAANAVGTSEVLNDSLTALDLAPDSVGMSELAANSVGAVELTANSVGASEIMASAVSTSEVLNNSLTANDLAPNSVGSSELQDDIDLGSSSVNGRLDLYRTTANTPGISLIGSNSDISTYGSDGLLQTRLFGTNYGELYLYNSLASNGRAVRLSAYGSSGGRLYLSNTNGGTRALLAGYNGGGYLSLYADDGSSSVFLSGDSSDAGLIDVRNNLGQTRVVIDGEGFNNGGEIVIDEADGSAAIEIQASSGGKLYVNDSNARTAALLGANGAYGGYQYLYNRNGAATLYATGDSGLGAYLALRNTNGSNRIVMDGYGSGGGGSAYFYATDGSATVTIHGEYGGAGLIEVDDSVSATRVRIDGESSGTGGEVSLYDNDGTKTVEIIAAESTTTGAQIELAKADGAVSIRLDADYASQGYVWADVFVTTGGSDLSERFDVAGSGVEPGMLVCIDPVNPGKLMVSSKAYDRKVAGVISGAGGVKTGMLMGQEGSIADGDLPIALSGRVYCMVDASENPVIPGDLITTSTVQGHGMAVDNHAQAQGAIIGKAMTPLAAGRGLVLVLVSLQ